MTRMTVRDVQGAMDNHAKCARQIIKIAEKFIAKTLKAIKKEFLSEYQHKDTL